MLSTPVDIPGMKVNGSEIMLFFMLGFLLFIPIRSEGQSFPGQIKIDEGGQLWIEGTAGPVDYKCRAEELSGKGEIENAGNPQSTVKGEGDLQVSVSLPVKSLDCGKRRMNNDMYGALKADEFPVISYQLLDASLAEPSVDTLSDDWMNIRTRGVMEIAGVKDTTSVFVQGKVSGDNKFHVKGNKDIHMDTYDIDPPSKMFGLIKASKELTVHFDVVVTLQDSLQ